MLTFDCTVSGDQIGRRLAEDAEELRYALEALIEARKPGRLAQELRAEIYSDESASGIAEFLRRLADGIDPATQAQ